jgi:hypothetical protein
LIRKGISMIYTIISDVNEGKREALLFPIAPGRLRIITRGRTDTTDLYSIDGAEWLTESGHLVRFDFLCGTASPAAQGLKAASAA